MSIALCSYIWAVFFFISKLLAFGLKPLFWVGILMLLAVIPRFKRLQRKLLIAAISVFFICGNSILVNEWALIWEDEPTPWPQEKVPVAVVLGGYSGYDFGRERVNLNQAAERYMAGVEIMLSDRAERLILTGGSAAILHTPYYESRHARSALGKLGIDTSRILIDFASRNTYENGVETKRMLDSLGIKEPVILVTSAFHMPRSKAIFNKLNIPIQPYPVHFLGNRTREYSPSAWFIPSGRAFEDFETLLREAVGYTAYRLTGKL
jgi:uncharacterized SAM-binding protein YcdF (DUF218 family)